MMLFSLLFACASNSSEGPFEGPTDQESYFVVVETTPSVIPFNEYFSAEIQVFAAENKTTPLEDVAVSIDATMPSHDHGMNEKAEVSGPENGIFQAEGLKWHMEGEWELVVYVDTEKAVFSVDCCSE